MTAVTGSVDPRLSSAPIVHEKALIRSWKAPIALGIFAVIALLVAFLAPKSGSSTFKLSTDGDAIQIPPITVPTGPTVVIVAILLALLALGSAAIVAFGSRGRTPLWLTILFSILFLFGFLTWSASGQFLEIPGLLASSVALSIPLIYGALGGVISERVGVVNVAIEGQLLFGAFTAALVSSATNQPVLGLIAAMGGGMLVSFVLAAFSIRYYVDQVIVGVVLNVLVTGITNFLYSEVLVPNSAVSTTRPISEHISIPGLSAIPVIGPVFFQQTVLGYLMYIAIFAVWYGLFRTKWGLRLRSVGEHPTAADTVGINVGRTRFWNVSLAARSPGSAGHISPSDAVSASTRR